MDIVIDDVSVDRSPLDEAQLVVDAAVLSAVFK